MLDFYRTAGGRKFLDGTMVRIANALSTLATQRTIEWTGSSTEEELPFETTWSPMKGELLLLTGGMMGPVVYVVRLPDGKVIELDMNNVKDIRLP